MVCDIHYDSKDLDATKVDADFYGKDFADELADIASLIDGILNIVVIKHCMPGDWEEISTTFKDVLISLMSNREGTDIESFSLSYEVGCEKENAREICLQLISHDVAIFARSF